MASTRKTPVLADVAKLAGVAPITVSRVVNNNPLVNAETRARVQKAIDELGYRSNMAARALAGGRSRVIGVISLGTEYFGPSHTLLGIEAAARTAGYMLSFVTLRDNSTDELRRAFDLLHYAQVEGAILLAALHSTAAALDALAPTLPLVITTEQAAASTGVAVDQHAGACAATRHLLDLGHETVHHVSGPAGWMSTDGRLAGWRDTLHERNCSHARVIAGDWSPRSGYRAGQILAADPHVSAVFVANDQMALGVMLALREAGRDVPGDVSIVGFDDTPESEFFAPPLTTVRQDFDEVGRRSLELLLQAIDGEAIAPVTIEPRLIVRSSTAAP